MTNARDYLQARGTDPKQDRSVQVMSALIFKGVNAKAKLDEGQIDFLKAQIDGACSIYTRAGIPCPDEAGRLAMEIATYINSCG